MSAPPASVEHVLSLVAENAPWLEARLAAEVSASLLIAAWRAAPDDVCLTVLARVFRAREEASAVGVLAPALRSESPDVKFEALRALGRIGTSRARRCIWATAPLLQTEDPATLLEAGRNAGVLELEPFAFSAIGAEDAIVRWRAARFLAQVGSPRATQAIHDAAENEGDHVWRNYMTEILEEMGLGVPRLRTKSTRSMVLSSPLFGNVPVVARLGAPRRFPTTGGAYALWDIRSRYAPLRIHPPAVARGVDGLGAIVEALSRIREALDSYEVERGWLSFEHGEALTLANFELDD